MSMNMSKAEREAFLAGLHVGVVSVAEPGKGPLTVPIWYDYVPGGDVWMITGRTSIKGKLFQSVDRISLCAQTESPPYQYVSIEGPISITDLAAGQLEQMAIRYLGEQQGKAYAAASGEAGNSIVVSITPETWYTIDYNKR